MILGAEIRVGAGLTTVTREERFLPHQEVLVLAILEQRLSKEIRLQKARHDKSGIPIRALITRYWGSSSQQARSMLCSRIDHSDLGTLRRFNVTVTADNVPVRETLLSSSQCET